MGKLIELEREEFLNEVTENWSKWKKSTTANELIGYMINNAFTKKTEATLKGISKEDLMKIIVNGDEVGSEAKSSPTSKNLGADFVEFFEDIKIDIHKVAFTPFVKKMIIKQIDKLSEKFEDINILDKMGYAGVVISFIFFILEMVFKQGYKGLRPWIKEFKEKRDAKKLADAGQVKTV